MKARVLAATAALLGLVVLPGCAGTGTAGGSQKLATYLEAAGAPVNSFSYHGRINGWTSIDDEHIAVWTRPSEAFLLGFIGRCHDIDYAPMISLTSQANRVYAGFDEVMVQGRGGIRMPCRIREIRPLDTGRLKAAERAAREGDQEPDSGT